LPRPLLLERVGRSFGGVRALHEVDLRLDPGMVHGLIGPNGSGKTTTLNIISGYYAPDAGLIRVGDEIVTEAPLQARSGLGIARTFQTPRILGELSVAENAMLGSYAQAHAGFVETALALGRSAREEREMRARAIAALETVGLAAWADARADRLQHSEQRFLEIARCLTMRPRFVLLDEPAAGLSASEIDNLALLIDEMRRLGMGVLLIEHHADFVFRISDVVTVLDFGRVLAQGSPEAVRSNPEVVHAYLGA
jgi:ABC-type branched-subunit amino acid transport system ATPase component